MLPAWFAEVEAFPSAVLAHHWPHVANFGDMCNLPYLVSTGLVPAPDILVGGTPCQAFSVSGLRKGLEDERGQLTLKFVEVANEIDKKRSDEECVVVWENVPGVLSSKDNAFGCFLGALAGEEFELKPTGGKWTNAGLVYGPKRAIAWRVLDAQYFGVAQRRRRVFVVASARKGFDPGAVLFESEGLRRDTPPSREKEKKNTRGVKNGSYWDSETNARPYTDDETAPKMKLRDYKDTTDLVTCFDSRRDANVYGDIAGTRTASTPVNAVAFAQNSRDEVRLEDGEIIGALSTGGGKPGQGYPAIMCDTVVRRLTPVECERLQGFPDNYTRIPWRGKAPEDCPDEPRYKAIGNSKAVPVIRFVGERIINELFL